MRIIVAPDKFKGSARAPEVAAALAEGLRAGIGRMAGPCADEGAGTRTGAIGHEPLEILESPVADGGEGTIDAAIGAGYRPRTLSVTGPAALPVQAVYAARGETAVIEMAQASGLDALPHDAAGKPVLDPTGATSSGTGELIAHALDQGARHIVLGLGGSACTDGGTGMLRALGVRWLDATGQELPRGGAALQRLEGVDLSGLHPAVAESEFVLAADVDNPLLGDRGAAAVFGPQKGADPAQVAVLEQGLTRLRDRMAREVGDLGSSAARAEGAGAAGGLGYAALAVLGARRRHGIDVVLDLVGFAEQVRGADLVITGEGSFDEQSLGGKAPMGVLRTARKAGVPVLVVCGRSLLTARQVQRAGFAGVLALSDRAEDPRTSIEQAPRLLRVTGAAIAEDLLAALVPRPSPALPVGSGP